MRRDEAPSNQPAVAGGGQTKAHAGCGFGKTANMGRGGHCRSTFAPVAQMDRALVSYPGGLPVRVWPGALFVNWTSERVNARKPATNARQGVWIAPVKAITLYHALGSQEPTMNTLSQDKKIQVLNALVEGCSIRSIERMTGVHYHFMLSFALV